MQCPRCNSSNIIKGGFNKLGKQMYWCNSCHFQTVRPIKATTPPSSLFNEHKCEACDHPITPPEGVLDHHFTTPVNPLTQTMKVCNSCNSKLSSSIWGRFSPYISNHILPSRELQRMYIKLSPLTPQQWETWDDLLESIYPFLSETKKEAALSMKDTDSSEKEYFVIMSLPYEASGEDDKADYRLCSTLEEAEELYLDELTCMQQEKSSWTDIFLIEGTIIKDDSTQKTTRELETIPIGSKR